MTLFCICVLAHARRERHLLDWGAFLSLLGDASTRPRSESGRDPNLHVRGQGL